MEAMLIDNITKNYGKHEVLKGITLNIEQGEIFTLLGENGAGKSTLINILTTLAKPTSGVAKILGHDVQTEADQVRKVLSLNSQAVTLDDEFTGFENMKLVGSLLGIPDLRRRIETISQRLHLTDFLHKKVGTYSGGMKRRLDIAVTLLPDTEIVFLDEPTTGVDPKNRLEIWQLIQELKAAGKTIFLTTQYLDEADRLSDHIAFINGGKISLMGTPAELKKQVRDRQQIEVAKEAIQQVTAILTEATIPYTLENNVLIVDGGDLQPALRRLVAAEIPVLTTTALELSLEEVFLDAT